MYCIYEIPDETQLVCDVYNLDPCVYSIKNLNKDINELFEIYNKVSKLSRCPVTFGISNNLIENIRKIKIRKLSDEIYTYISKLKTKYKLNEYEDIISKLKFRERLLLSKSIYFIYILSKHVNWNPSSLKHYCMQEILHSLIRKKIINISNISSFLDKNDAEFIQVQLTLNLSYERLCKQHRPQEALKRLSVDTDTILCKHICDKLEYMWATNWRTRIMCIDTIFI